MAIESKSAHGWFGQLAVFIILQLKRKTDGYLVKDCFLANSWNFSTQYVAMKTAQNNFYNCTFSCYNCTIRHQQHTKICPDESLSGSIFDAVVQATCHMSVPSTSELGCTLVNNPSIGLKRRAFSGEMHWTDSTGWRQCNQTCPIAFLSLHKSECTSLWPPSNTINIIRQPNCHQCLIC